MASYAFNFLLSVNLESHTVAMAQKFYDNKILWFASKSFRLKVDRF